MIYLVAGLVIFLGIHSSRVFAEDWRSARIGSMGAGGWKGVYTLISLAGFALIVYGYGQARLAPVDLWFPPRWTNHATALLMLPVFIMLAAAGPQPSRIKAKLKHPMTLAVLLWAGAHLLSNGRLNDVLLFGGFLAWAVLVFIAARKRDRKLGTSYAAQGVKRDVIALVIGLGVYALFALWLHRWLIGVAPFG
jgi:uncharacterized membrane protein